MKEMIRNEHAYNENTYTQESRCIQNPPGKGSE
jgi:hypothetical protein